MAMTFKQRRRRDIAIGVIAAALILSLTMGKQIVKAFDVSPGYARKAPTGNYSPLDWTTMSQAGLNKGQVPADLNALSGQLVTLQGYIVPQEHVTKSSNFALAERTRDDLHCLPQGQDEVLVYVNIAEGVEANCAGSPVVSAYGKLRIAFLENRQAVPVIDNAVLVAKR